MVEATERLTRVQTPSGQTALEDTNQIVAAFGDLAAQRQLIEEFRARRDWGYRGAISLQGLFGLQDDLLAFSPANPNDFSLELALAAWLPAMNVRERREYYAEMERYGIAAYWAANGYPRGCRLVESPQGNHLDCSERR